MIVKLSFLIAAASVAAYAVKLITIGTWRPQDFNSKVAREDDEDHLESSSNHGLKDQESMKEEEKEEPKIIKTIINPISSSPILYEDKYEIEKVNNANELVRLHHLVHELEETKIELEMELLDYQKMKEKESTFVELQKQLKMKTEEVDILESIITSLHIEKEKLQEEVLLARKELEKAQNKIKELQMQFQLEANQTKTQLLLLKQQVRRIQEEEQVEFKAMKDLELEIIKLKRNNKELQHEKREIKLDRSESKSKSISNVT